MQILSTTLLKYIMNLTESKGEGICLWFCVYYQPLCLKPLLYEIDMKTIYLIRL